MIVFSAPWSAELQKSFTLISDVLDVGSGVGSVDDVGVGVGVCETLV